MRFGLLYSQQTRPDKPATQAQLYREMLEELEAGEALGFDSAWLVEHHFLADGLCPSPLIAAAAPVWLILLTAAIVNLRFVIFSAGLHSYFRKLSLSRRLLLGYLTGDVGYLLAIRRWHAHPQGAPASTGQVWFYLGLAAANWLTWQAMSVAGILLALARTRKGLPSARTHTGEGPSAVDTCARRPRR